MVIISFKLYYIHIMYSKIATLPSDIFIPNLNYII